MDSRGVVIENGEGVGTGVDGLGKDVLMGNHPSKFKITDGEISGAIAISNEALLNGERKRGTPQQGGGTINKPDTSHARFCGINSANAQLKVLRTSLQKTIVTAPVSGIISKLNVEKGERVVGTLQMAGTEMMRIANLSSMEVQVDVSERGANSRARSPKSPTAPAMSVPVPGFP